MVQPVGLVISFEEQCTLYDTRRKRTYAPVCLTLCGARAGCPTLITYCDLKGVWARCGYVDLEHIGPWRVRCFEALPNDVNRDATFGSLR